MATLFLATFLPDTTGSIPATTTGPAPTIPSGAVYNTAGGETELVSFTTSGAIIYTAGQTTGRDVRISFGVGTLPEAGSTGSVTFSAGAAAGNGYVVSWDSNGALTLVRIDAGVVKILKGGLTVTAGMGVVIDVTDSAIVVTANAFSISANDTTYALTDLAFEGSIQGPLKVTDLAAQTIYPVDELITQVRALADEPDNTNTYTSDATILSWLNLAQMDIQKAADVNPFRASIHGASFNAQHEYALTYTPLRVELVTIDDVPVRPMRYQDRESGYGLLLRVDYFPEGYYLRGQTLGIPDIQDGNTVELSGQRPLDKLVSGGDVALPLHFNECLIFRVLWYWGLKERDRDMIGTYRELYKDSLRVAVSDWQGTQHQVDTIQEVV